jgi:membrane fusion protein (multidrug efflux system)
MTMNSVAEQQMEQPTYSEAIAEDQAIAQQASRMTTHKKLWIGLGIALACLAIFFGVRYILWSSTHEETDDAYLEAHVHAVSSRVAGTVAQVLVDDNQHVNAGQTLALLDANDYQVRVDQAQANLDVALRQAQTAQASVKMTSESALAQSTEANGSISEATSGIASAQAELAVTQAGVPRAQAELAKTEATEHRAELDQQRYDDLLAKGQVSRQTADHAHEAYQVAVAARVAAQQAVTQAEAEVLKAQQAIATAHAQLEHSQGVLQSAKAAGLEINVRNDQYSSSQASVAQASAALEDAKLQLSYTRIVAPTSGRIGKKSIEVGQRVQVGQPLLAVVEDNPWIVANFKETQLGKMRDKQPVEIKIDSFPHHRFRGHVDSLAPGSGNTFALLPPDNATGNFTKIVQRVPVKIVFDPDSMDGYEGLMSPGISALVTVTTK